MVSTSDAFYDISPCRGGKWYPENVGFWKLFFRSRNLGGVLNESRNLVFLSFFASRKFWPRGLKLLDFCLLANGFNQIHNKIVYLIAVLRICRHDKSGF